MLTFDIIVGLPDSNGYDQAGVLVDKFTKQIAVLSGKLTWTAKDWGCAIVKHCQQNNWGIPTTIITDHDTKFVSDMWHTIFTVLQVNLHYSAAYHPQTDGQSERMIQTIEIALRHWTVNNFAKKWTESIPHLHTTLNSTPNALTGQSPHKLLYGITLRQPWNLLCPALDQDFAICQDAEECLRFAAITMKQHYDAKHKPLVLATGDKAYIQLHKGYSTPLSRKLGHKLGPQQVRLFPILKKVGNLAYKLKLLSTLKLHPVISVAHLEPVPRTPDPYNC